MSSDPPIIITNGSITIQFDTSAFPPSGDGKFYNPAKRIRNVVIEGDGIRFAQDIPSKGRMVIIIHYGAMNDPPIVITNGSITIEFDTKIFVRGAGSFSHPAKRIRRVEIKGDGIDFVQDVPSKGRMVIKVYYSSELGFGWA